MCVVKCSIHYKHLECFSVKLFRNCSKMEWEPVGKTVWQKTVVQTRLIIIIQQLKFNFQLQHTKLNRSTHFCMYLFSLFLLHSSMLHNNNKRSTLTFSMCDAVRRDGSTNVDHATAIGHLILTGVFTGVVVVDWMHDTQIQDQTIQNLERGKWQRIFTWFTILASCSQQEYK